MEAGKDKVAELKKLFRIYKTVMQMMLDRGYYVADQLKQIDFSQFEERSKDRIVRDTMTLSLFKRTDESQKIYVFFSDKEKFTKEDLKIKIEVMKNSGFKNALIVLQNETNVNPADFEQEFHIEFFKEEELYVNITEHELVPKHVLISDEEKKELLIRYKVKESQLPRILISDPIARYYGLKRGDVVKIIRDSETAGRYITYRLVS